MIKFLNLSKNRNKEDYLKIFEFAKNYNHDIFFNELLDYFNYIHDKEIINNIALYLQICIKGSRPLYLHGFIITSALYNYINTNKINNINILETGTARGFSSICMATILKDLNINGKIYTIDFLKHHEKIIWNCIDAPNKKEETRYNLLEKWSCLRDNYINFLEGYSKDVLINLNLKRINFAFLDGGHTYDELTFELDYVKKYQISGDVIICDDYTLEQFPELFNAINDFLKNNIYEHKIFYGDDGTKKRGYVYMKKK